VGDILHSAMTMIRSFGGTGTTTGHPPKSAKATPTRPKADEDKMKQVKKPDGDKGKNAKDEDKHRADHTGTKGKEKASNSQGR